MLDVLGDQLAVGVTGRVDELQQCLDVLAAGRGVRQRLSVAQRALDVGEYVEVLRGLPGRRGAAIAVVARQLDRGVPLGA